MNTEALKSIPLFSEIDSRPLEFLAEQSEVKQLKKKHTVFFHGDKIRYFHLIVSGWVKLFRDTLDGQEALLGLSKAKDIITDIDKNHHSFSAETISSARILVMPISTFRSTIEENRTLSIKVIKALDNEKSLLELQLEHASTMNAAQKVACFILRLSDASFKSFRTKLPYDKNLIASSLNMKGETFSRALKDLQFLGVEVNGNCLEINDTTKLMKFCCVSCSLAFDSCKN